MPPHRSLIQASAPSKPGLADEARTGSLPQARLIINISPPTVNITSFAQPPPFYPQRRTAIAFRVLAGGPSGGVRSYPDVLFANCTVDVFQLTGFHTRSTETFQARNRGLGQLLFKRGVKCGVARLCVVLHGKGTDRLSRLSTGVPGCRRSCRG